jgi:hypothetical protein
MLSYRRTIDEGCPFDSVYGDQREGCVVEKPDEIATWGKDGRKRLNAKIEIVGFHEEQPDRGLPSHSFATLKITGRLPNGETDSYEVVQPYQDVLRDFDGVLAKILRPGVQYDNTNNSLLTLVLLSSDPQTAYRCPVQTASSAFTAEGIVHDGLRVCSAPIEVIAKSAGESGFTVYHLRLAREDGNGFEYFDVASSDFMGILPATMSVGDRQIRVHDPIKATMALSSRYEALSEKEREGMVQERDSQLRREAKQKIEKVLRETLPMTRRGHEVRARLRDQLRQYR